MYDFLENEVDHALEFLYVYPVQDMCHLLLPPTTNLVIDTDGLRGLVMFARIFKVRQDKKTENYRLLDRHC